VVEPLFHLDFASLPTVGQIVELTGAEAKHAASVRRMREGEAIQFTNGKGLRIRASVRSAASNSLTAEVQSAVQENSPDLQITLVQALAKGDRDELAIQAATELGVMQVVPWQAERSISRWIGLKEEKGRERWQTIVNEAAKQSLRSFTPEVMPAITSANFEQLVEQFDLVLVLDPTATAGVNEIDFNGVRKVALVVGPEGGISDAELEGLQKAKAVRVHLGESILRTSTAGVAAIAALNVLSGAWSSRR
jgi:16S rRNA (uracil1498-N3)-methyltransferase